MPDLEHELSAELTLVRAELDRERRARRQRIAVHRMAARTSGQITRNGVAAVIASGAADLFNSGWVMVGFVGDDDIVTFVHGPRVPDIVAREWQQAPLSTAVPICDVLRGETASVALNDPSAFAPWPILGDWAKRAEIGSLFVQPISGTDRPHAVVALAWPEPHELDDDDQQLLDELLDAARPAFARAGTTEADRELVATLQNWLLPADLPDIDGLELAKLYEPGRVAMDVGGDWYDVVKIDDSRFSVVIGDVVGHDARAAAEMGQVRHVLAAHLMVTGSPAESLQLTDDYFDRRSPNTMATALVMLVDSTKHTIELASAGHLPPVMAELGASSRVVDCGLGPPIGSGLGGYGSLVRPFPQHALLVAFTDGIVELRDQTIDESLVDFCGAIDECIAGVQRDAAEPAQLDALIAMMSDRVANPDRTDDAAAVVCRAMWSRRHPNE